MLISPSRKWFILVTPQFSKVELVILKCLRDWSRALVFNYKDWIASRQGSKCYKLSRRNPSQGSSATGEPAQEAGRTTSKRGSSTAELQDQEHNRHVGLICTMKALISCNQELKKGWKNMREDLRAQDKDVEELKVLRRADKKKLTRAATEVDRLKLSNQNQDRKVFQMGRNLKANEREMNNRDSRIGELEVLLRNCRSSMYRAEEKRDEAYDDRRITNEALVKEKGNVIKLLAKVDKLSAEKESALIDCRAHQARAEKNTPLVAKVKKELHEQKDKVAKILGPSKNKSFEELLTQTSKSTELMRVHCEALEGRNFELDTKADELSKELKQANSDLIISVGNVTAKETKLAKVQTEFNELLPVKNSLQDQVTKLERDLVLQKADMQKQLNEGCRKMLSQLAEANGLSPPTFSEDDDEEEGNEYEGLGDDDEAEDEDEAEESPPSQ